jgi:lysophospholipase L1-like esterase
MSAKNGLTRSLRLLGCLMAVALLGSALFASGASAMKKAPITKTYLALGDSLAFGYSQQLYNEGIVAGFENPENFEAGYVQDLWNRMKGAKKGIRLQNDGCPGETTTSMIGPALAKKLNETTQFEESQAKKESLPITGTESPPASLPNCLYQEAWNVLKTVGGGGPLHHSYGGKSQLEDAINTIKEMSIAKQPVTTITLNIGPNDQLHGVKAIEKEIEAKVAAFAEGQVRKKFVEPAATKEVEEKIVAPIVQKELEEKYIGPAVFQKCFEKALGETGGAEPETEEKTNLCLATEGKTLGEEYAFEHAKELHEKGVTLGVEYQIAHAKELTEAGEKFGLEYFVEHKKELEEKGSEIGHKFAAEHAAELAKEGEELFAQYVKGEGKYAGKGLGEQILSNISGILYALRNGSKYGGVNYAGAIYFLNAYDPYGKLFKTAAEASTFVNAHGGPTGPFAAENTGGKIHPLFNALGYEQYPFVKAVVSAYGGCSTNAMELMNTEGKNEPMKLQKYTNMANGTITAGKFDGPDIHPTPKGYKAIAKLMQSNCKISGLARTSAKRH